MEGKVYLVGAGPGEPDLITVRGADILRQAEVVIYDYLVDKRILGYAKEGTELICCDKLGKNRHANNFLAPQNRINNLLISKIKEGKKVVRLKNGDPSIFSRCSQELDILARNNIEFEVVPGVSAGVAAASFSGIPLTDRRFASSCVFVTGQQDPKKKGSLLEWNSLAKINTLVFYMSVDKLGEIVSKLLRAGRDENTPVAVIQDISLITHRIITGTLNDIARKKELAKIQPPAIVIIGEVVKLEKEFNWLRKNKRVLFTGLSRQRFFIKGTYFHLPLIKIEPLGDYSKFDNYL
jgi:uroporphyrinogen III methyltransferase/synthase